MRKTLAALLLAAVAAARARAGDASPGPEPAPTPTPTAAAAQAATPKAEAKPRMDIYGFAMLDMGYQSGQNDPNWFDVAAADEAAGLREPVRRGRPLLRRRAPEPARREGLHPDRRRRDQDHLRVRAVRHRRRRRADDVPPAPRLGRARAVRRGPDLEPVHGPRRVPELGRVLGPERDGLLPERPAPLDALVRTATRASRSRSSGRGPPPTRACTRVASSSRASRRASRCRTSRPSSATRRAGATSRWPGSCGR